MSDNNTHAYDNSTNVNRTRQEMPIDDAYRLRAQHLSVPILPSLVIQAPDNPQTVMLASKPGMTEQLVSDGPLGDQPIQQRIDLVFLTLIESTELLQRQFGVRILANDIVSIGDYETEEFSFKLYLHDQQLVDQYGMECAIRNLYAFFIDSHWGDFYQMSLSAGPMQLPLRQCRLGVVDSADPLFSGMMDMMRGLMDNLHG